MTLRISIVWLAFLIGTGIAEAGDPRAEAAIRYVEALRSGKPETGTVISPSTGPSRREDIRRQWQSLRGQLATTGAIHSEEIRASGDLAAAIVRLDGAETPMDVIIVGVALIRSGDGWQAAPLPGLFDNAGLPYDPEIRGQANALEYWMAEQQVQRLGSLRNKAAVEFTEAMEASLTWEEISTSSTEALMERFLDAVEARDLPATMALLGGLESPRPDHWDETLRIVSRWLNAPRGTPVPYSWHLLTHPEVARAAIETGEHAGDAYFSVGFYDPHRVARNPGAVQQMYFEFLAIGGGWRLSLPEELRIEPALAEQSGIMETPMWFGGEDEDLTEWFPGRFEARFDPLAFETLEALAEAVVQTMKAGAFPELLRMLDRVEGEPETRRASYRGFARMWDELRPAEEATLISIFELVEDGPAAVILLQRFAAKRGDDIAVRELYAIRSERGWHLLAPGSAPEAEEAAAAHGRLAAGEGDRRRNRTERARRAVLRDAVALKQIPAEGVPPEAAEAAVRAWRDAAEAGDLAGLLAHSAWFAGPDEERTVLRTLGYEAAASARGNVRSEVLGSHRDGVWTGVTARVHGEKEATYPMYAVVSTPDGPRVLLTLDLVFPAGRVREFLNNSQWNRLGGLIPKDEVKVLQRLYGKHRELANATMSGAGPVPQ